MAAPQFDLKTANGMLEYCIYYELSTGNSKKWALKHFELLAADFTPDERVLFVFIGIHNYVSATKHDNNAAYAITTKRIVTAQKNLIGQAIMSVSIDHVNDIKLKTGLLGGIVTFDAMSETFNVFLNKEIAQRVFDFAKKCVDHAKSLKAPKSTVQEPGNSLSDLRELNDLLKEGIITQAEFDAKKKQILGI